MKDPISAYLELAPGVRPASAAEAQELAAAADSLRGDGRHLAAAQVHLAAHQRAWGAEPQILCTQLLVQALEDLLRALAEGGLDPWSKALALHLLASNANSLLMGMSAGGAARVLGQSAQVEYQRHVSVLAEAEGDRSALLVSGFQLKGFLDSGWEPVFPGCEVSSGAVHTLDGGRLQLHGMDSALHSSIGLADYAAAAALAEDNEGWLLTPGLKGWAAAAQAFVTGDALRFDAASKHFSQDAHDRPGRAESDWSGINQQLWAKYFRSRSVMAERATNATRRIDRRPPSSSPSSWQPRRPRPTEPAGSNARVSR